MQYREVSFEGTKVSIGFSESAVDDIIGFLFHDLDVDESATLIESLEVSRDSETQEWLLKHNHKNLFKGRNIAAMATVLMGEVLFHLIRENDQSLAIHAGLVSKDNQSILIPGNSGSGKSSVTTWLVSQGFQYHTDELVSIDLQNRSLKAFTRPLNIKTPGVQAIKGLMNFRKHQSAMLVSRNVTMIPHRLVNAKFSTVIPPLSCLVFPKYIAESESELVPLTRAEAGLEMMRSNVIARNLPSHGFTQITQLVKDLPAYRINYQHFDDLKAFVNEIT